MSHVIDLAVGALIGWCIAHFYYRRSKADFGALQSKFDALQSAVQRAIDQGIVSADRTATGQISGLKRPSAPTDFRIS